MTEAIDVSAWPACGMAEVRAGPTPEQGAGWSLPTLLAHVSDRFTGLGVADRRSWLRSATQACAGLLAVREQLKLALAAHQRIAALSCVASGRQELFVPPSNARPDLARIGLAMQACVDQALRQWQQSGQRFARVLMLLPTQLDPGVGLPESVESEVVWASLAGTAGHPVRRGESMDGLLRRYEQAHRRCLARRSAARLAKERRRALDQTVGILTLPALEELANALLNEYLCRQALLQAQADCASARWEIDCLLSAGLPAPGAPASGAGPLGQCTAPMPLSSPSFEGVWNHRPAKTL